MTDFWDEPEGIAPRGTVIVAAGRGETTGVYARFGRRIAADGYRVRVLPDVTADLPASLAAAEKLLVDDSLPGPRVVAGSDTGALFALALARRAVPGLDGLVLAGLPGSPARPSAVVDLATFDLSGLEAEVEARTACPNHQRVLSGGASLFSAPIPTELIEPTGYGSIPTLGVHGGADTISPLQAVRYPGAPVVIEGGRHDILNDVTHRTVAALIVLFLEKLRNGAEIVRATA
ncbi:alpha/beta hydrolase [Actinoplanes sp. NPDC051494]|uniref:alpha/beta hydrolase n=1 Tax=Actinoplanes sp. NPDC051494 TaxID=3363907 RepID=UPI0037AA7CFA